MKIDFENAKIYVRPGSTDLRKDATGLAQIIENEMKLNALSESVFLFCNKNHKLLKVIFWNKTGFQIAQKRLERATWPWPNTEVSAREITNEQLMMLLSGIDFWRAHEEIKFNAGLCQIQFAISFLKKAINPSCCVKQNLLLNFY